MREKLEGRNFDGIIIDDLICNKKSVSKKKFDKIWDWIKRNFSNFNSKVFPGTPWHKNNSIDKKRGLK